MCIFIKRNFNEIIFAQQIVLILIIHQVHYSLEMGKYFIAVEFNNIDKNGK